MFIKFEYNKNTSTTINKECIIGIECRNVKDEHNNIHELRFFLMSQQYPEVIYFKNKKSLEKAYDALFNKLYQDNTLIIFTKKDGIKEPVRLVD